MSLVSVIIPNYNHASFLSKRIESVLNQTYPNLEVIILDDASTDNSWDIIKYYQRSDARVSVVKNNLNSGSPFKQWQKGIELANGNYIWIAESDDYCETDFLESLISPMTYDSDIGISYCQSFDVEGSKKSHRLSYTAEFNPNLWENDFTIDGYEFVNKYLSVKNVIPNASAVVFRNEFIKHLDYKPIKDMKMLGDWLFWLQICKYGKLHFCSFALNYFRRHPSVSRNHDSRQKKKQRLAEEIVVREYINLHFPDVNQSIQFDSILRKWGGMHNLMDFLLLRPFTAEMNLGLGIKILTEKIKSSRYYPLWLNKH